MMMTRPNGSPMRFRVVIRRKWHGVWRSASGRRTPGGHSLAMNRGDILRSILNAPVPATTLEDAAQQWVEEAAAAFASSPSDLGALEKLRHRLEVAKSLAAQLVLWEAQNITFTPLLESHQHWQSEAGTGNPNAQTWLNALGAVSQMLGIRLKESDGTSAAPRLTLGRIVSDKCRHRRWTGGCVS